MIVLANDGVSESGIKALENANFTVLENKVEQSQLANFINEENVEVLLVRSATKVRKDLIDACPSLRLIGRGGVGLDNIDVDYAQEMGLKVINTPAASSHSVAELVFAHLMGMVRFLPDSNRNMPLSGEKDFKKLKKNYAKGIELKGKTMGVIGFGRIGEATLKIALSLGMKPLVATKTPREKTVSLDFFDGQTVDFKIASTDLDTVLKNSDFISLHIPAQKDYVLGEKEFTKMKKGAGIINAARGGIVNEVALVNALESGHLAYAALDVFEKEPTPEMQLLMNPELSLSPHIGGATVEAQDRIGTELAEQIIAYYKL